MVGRGSGHGHRPVPSWAGRMGEHAGGTIPTGREIPASNHTGDFRGRQITNAWVSREVRRVIGAIRERRRRTGVVISAQWWIICLWRFSSTLLHVYLFLRSRLCLWSGPVRTRLEGVVDQLLDRRICSEADQWSIMIGGMCRISACEGGVN